MTRRFSFLAIAATALAGPLEAQQLGLGELYARGAANYQLMQKGGCSAKPENYLDALKFFYAYYQMRIAAAPREEVLQLSKVVEAAQTEAAKCLDLRSFSSAGMSTGGAVVATVPLPVVPPVSGQVPDQGGAAVARLTEQLGAAEAERNAYRGLVDRFLPAVSSVEGAWLLKVEVNGQSGILGHLVILQGSSGLTGWLMQYSPTPGTPAAIELGTAQSGVQPSSIFPQGEQYLKFQGGMQGQPSEITLHMGELNVRGGRTGVPTGLLTSGGSVLFFRAYRPGDPRAR
jgi:hypothetical protein